MPFSDYDPIFEAAGREWNVDPDLLRAVAMQESRGNPKAVSKAGARGLMQIMPGTATALGVDDPFHPAQSIYGAAKLLDQNLQQFGNVPDALRAYNAGDPGRWNNSETAAYVPSVANHYKNFVKAKGPVTSDQTPDYVSAILKGGSDQAPPQPQQTQDASTPDYVATILKNAQEAKAPAPVQVAAAQPTGIADRIKSDLLDPGAPVSSDGTLLGGASSRLQNLTSGVKQGLRDTAGGAVNIANAVQSGAQEQALMEAGLDPRLSAAPAMQGTADALAATRRAYDARFADSGAAMAGRLGGQLLGTAPVMGPLARAAGGIGEGIGSLLGNGLVGRGAGNVLTGAGIGAGAGALVSGQSDDSLGKQMAVGGLVGGAFGPIASVAGKTAGSIANMLTSSGRERLADNILAKAAAGGPLTSDAREIVEGSIPTLAQATANPGLATLERGFRNTPGQLTPFVARDEANAAARVDAFNAVQGDKASLKALIEARQANMKAGEARVFNPANITSVDPTAAVQKIDEILAGRSGQRDAVKEALGAIRQKIVLSDDDTGMVLQTDPSKLYGIRQAIDDAMSPGAKSSSRLATRELISVQNVLDPIIESGAPGWKQNISNFAAASRPIDEMEYLKSKTGVTNSAGQITLGNASRLLKDIESERDLPGIQQAKSISDNTLNSLTAIRDDLLRANNSRLGLPMGSSTVQNLGINAMMEGMGIPLTMALSVMHGPSGAIAGYLLNKLMTPRNGAVLDTLSNKLLDPQTKIAETISREVHRIGMAPYFSIPAVSSANRLTDRRVGANR